MDLNVIVVLPFSLHVPAGELRFFLNVQKVVKVVEGGNLSPLPRAMAPFSGVLDLDGAPVPVIPLDAWSGADFGDAKATPLPAGVAVSTGTRIIICNVMDRRVGIEVSRTRKIMRLRNETLLPPPDLLSGRRTKLIAGVVKEERGFIYMFDLEGLLESHGVELARQASNTGPLDSLVGRRILVVEDSTFFQNLARKLLEKHGATVEIAGNGIEALDVLEARPDAYDLVFTDIEMPLLNGIELARELKRRAVTTPIIFHSSISNPALIADVEAEGLGQYLVKFDEAHIVGHMRQLLAA
jgi:chemotaxis signal transduction protein